MADEWVDVDPEPTHSPAPLTTESTGGQQPVERWLSSVEKEKGVHTDEVNDLQEQGDTSVCTPLPSQTPSASAVPAPEKDLPQGIFEETFLKWYRGETEWESLLDAAVSTIPGRNSFFSSKLEQVRHTKVLTESYTVTDALRDKIVA